MQAGSLIRPTLDLSPLEGLLLLSCTLVVLAREPHIPQVLGVNLKWSKHVNQVCPNGLWHPGTIKEIAGGNAYPQCRLIGEELTHLLRQCEFSPN